MNEKNEQFKIENQILEYLKKVKGNEKSKKDFFEFVKMLDALEKAKKMEAKK